MFDTKTAYSSVHNQPIPSGAVVSRWTIGWRTLTAIVAFYSIAWIAAVMHLTMFLVLDGHPADEWGSLSQSHVTTVSLLLANTFKASLCAALAVAFSQYLWQLLRVRSMTVGTIDALFMMPYSSFYLLARPTVWTAAPLLALVAALMQALSVVKIFPPGALTIVPQMVNGTRSLSVATFDPELHGNGSVEDARAHAIGQFYPNEGYWYYTGMHPLLDKITRGAMFSNSVFASASPCGGNVNCTFELTFEGPYAVCNETTTVDYMPAYTMHGDGFNATYHDYYRGYQEVPVFLGGAIPVVINATSPHFSTFTSLLSTAIGFEFGFKENGKHNITALLGNFTTLVCAPASINYSVQVSYENGVRGITYTTASEPVLLDDIYVPCPAADVGWDRYPYCNDTTGVSDDYIAINWTQDGGRFLTNYRTTNLYALFDAVTSALAGTLPMYVKTWAWNATANTFDYEHNPDPINYTLPNGTVRTILPATYTGFEDPETKNRIDIHRTIISYTSANLNSASLNTSSEPVLSITPALLNDFLANATLSAVFAFPYWTAPAIAARTSAYRTAYAFAFPMRLFAPYGGALFAALPFLALGMAALLRNGVAAPQPASFAQMLTTTAASKRLASAAAGGSLGGAENVPRGLTRTRVRFGEVVGPGRMGEHDVVRTAGFGLEDEVVPLRRDGVYGIVLREGGGDEKGRSTC